MPTTVEALHARAWTGMPLPDSAVYVIPEALGTLHVDRDADLATLVEPGIWIQHR